MAHGLCALEDLKEFQDKAVPFFLEEIVAASGKLDLLLELDEL